MMAVLEFHRKQPGFVRHLLHGMRCRIPFIKIPDEADGLRLRSLANKVYCSENLFAAVLIDVHALRQQILEDGQSSFPDLLGMRLVMPILLDPVRL